MNGIDSDKTWIELRVLKINKDEDGPIGRKSCFALSGTELRKLQERKWLELKFKNVTIGDCLIFVLVCTAFRDLSELQQEIMSFHKNTYNPFAKEWLTKRGLKSYKMSRIHPKTKLPITCPLRGPRCEHIECE